MQPGEPTSLPLSTMHTLVAHGQRCYVPASAVPDLDDGPINGREDLGSCAGCLGLVLGMEKVKKSIENAARADILCFVHINVKGFLLKFLYYQIPPLRHLIPSAILSPASRDRAWRRLRSFVPFRVQLLAYVVS